MPDFDLSGRTALVTGAGRGLGRGMAEALADANATVVGVARSGEQLEAMTAAVNERGGDARPLPWDLADAERAGELVDAVVAEAGRVDVLLHAAGIQVRAPARDLDLNGWDRVHAVHLRSAFALAKAVADHLIATDRQGSLLFVASLTSYLGIPGTAAYGSAKTGVLGLMRNLAVEWAPYGIRSNAIVPGYYHTDLTDELFRDPERREQLCARIPMGRPGAPEELGGAAVFLASDAARYITGQALAVDGGWLAG